MTLGGAPRPHVVVFDVNVYLDVARLVGEPFTWEAFDVLAREHASRPLPYHDGRIDSLRAIAVTTTGRVCAHQQVEVWTSSHIDGLVVTKAQQPNLPSLEDERRGLGWEQDAARGLLDDLVHDLVFDWTGGGTTGRVEVPWAVPPLSHEDGCVYATLRDAAPDLIEPLRVCVTRDREFLAANPYSNAQVWHPADWVQYVRQSRRADGPPLPAPVPTRGAAMRAQRS